MPKFLEVTDKAAARTAIGATATGSSLMTAASAAAARTSLSAQRQATFDVRDYGAVGDGTTDDAASIQDAIDAAVTAGGGQVNLPAGQYKLTVPITLGDNVDLVGTGSGSVLKPIYPSPPPNNVINNDWEDGNVNISLRNFKIDRSGANVQHGILLNGVDNLLIDGIEISGRPSAGGIISISGVGPATRIVSTNVRVVNCHFRETGNFGCHFGAVDNGLMANNTAYSTDREIFGVEPYGGVGETAKNITIANNVVYGKATISGSYTGLIVVTTSSGGPISNVAITGNVLRQQDPHTNPNVGITVLGATNVSITGNVVDRMGSYGMWIGGSGTPVTGAVINGNTVTSCALNSSGAGIRLRYADHCVVTGNYVYGASHTASLEEETGCGNNMIMGNHFRDATPIIQAATSLVFANKSVDGQTTFLEFPHTAYISAHAPANSQSHATTGALDANAPLGISRYQNVPAVNRWIEWTVFVDAGTYSISLLHTKNLNIGIYTISIDGVEFGTTIDGYAASSTKALDTVAGITIDDAGKHAIRLTMATKNASSSGYQFSISALSLTRTGA